MGQKVDPRILRLGINKEWDSQWYASKKDYAVYLLEDDKLRKFLKKELFKAGISRIIIKRKAKNVIIDIICARPGMIIGKGGQEAEKLKKHLIKMIKKEIQLNIKEEENVAINSVLLAESVAFQLAKRMPFRRAMKQSITRALKGGAQGIKIRVAGRLNGAEIARAEWYLEGKVPLHTLRSDIDYGTAEADTTYGKLGVKVWVYKGDILDKKDVKVDFTADVELEEERENVNA